MDPISGVVEKKVADSVFDAVKKWWNRNHDLKKENEALKAQLDEKAEFERKMAEFGSRPEDDGIYWHKDGGAFCPLCINGPERRFTPLTHGVSKGSYCCPLHDRYFETQEARERRSAHLQALSGRRLRGPRSWMGR